MKSIPSNQTLDIQGNPFSHTRATLRIVLAAACIGLGILILNFGQNPAWRDSVDGDWLIGLLTVIAFIIAAILPYNTHTFLDLEASDLVTLKHYAWLRIGNRRCPLTDFSRIVMGHVCHPGGEGPDTFTGSVGLKPTDGGAVFWLKEFPTTRDEIPRATYEFATMLQRLLAMPVSVVGMEFLDLERQLNSTAQEIRNSPRQREI